MTTSTIAASLQTLAKMAPKTAANKTETAIEGEESFESLLSGVAKLLQLSPSELIGIINGQTAQAEGETTKAQTLEAQTSEVQTQTQEQESEESEKTSLLMSLYASMLAPMMNPINSMQMNTCEEQTLSETAVVSGELKKAGSSADAVAGISQPSAESTDSVLSGGILQQSGTVPFEQTLPAKTVNESTVVQTSDPMALSNEAQESIGPITESGFSSALQTQSATLQSAIQNLVEQANGSVSHTEEDTQPVKAIKADENVGALSEAGSQSIQKQTAAVTELALGTQVNQKESMSDPAVLSRMASEQKIVMATKKSEVEQTTDGNSMVGQTVAGNLAVGQTEGEKSTFEQITVKKPAAAIQTTKTAVQSKTDDLSTQSARTLENNQIPLAAKTSQITGQTEGTKEVSFKTAADPDSVSISSQISTGVKDAIGQNQMSFKLKLRPEGLGQVTINMVCEDSKISLEIQTSLPATQKLLSGQMENLRAELGASHYQITSVNIQSVQESFSAAQNGLAYSNSGQNGQRYQNLYQHTASSEQSEQSESDLSIPVQTLMSRLNYRI